MDYFTVVFLLDPGFSRLVMLKRPANAKFAPNRWTGIGGHVETGEDVRSAALRELFEETGITKIQVKDFRHIASISYAGGNFWPGGYQTDYFDGVYENSTLPECHEGTIEWISLERLDQLDIIEDTKDALRIFVSSVFGKKLNQPLLGKFEMGERGVTDKVVLI